MSKEIRLKGTPICAGIAIGPPLLFACPVDIVPQFNIKSEEVEKEVGRYQTALQHSKQDVIRLQKQLKGEGALDAVDILDTHLQIMQDPLITTSIERQIRAMRKNAEYIFSTVIDEYQEKFNKLSSEHFRERFQDIQDISKRIVGHLRHAHRASLASLKTPCVVFARELLPTDTAEAQTALVKGFVTEQGGKTSHAAIVANAKGIPYISNVDFKALGKIEIEQVIIDGSIGTIILNPDKETLATYKKMHKSMEIGQRGLEKKAQLEAVTKDGVSIRLSANIDTSDDFESLQKYGGVGVGLFRSEYLFLKNKSFPSEDEQFDHYQKLVKGMKGLPVVIRTFDIGGDKLAVATRNNAVENNPFLGCRAIRFMLKEKDLFKQQIRAILRASIYGNVSILFPMISSLGELLEAKKLVKEAKKELRNQGYEIATKIKIGCMIEVPSAALICDLLLKECDFLSIGTNDLVQYALAVDRGNQALEHLYSPTHPGILRLIKMVVEEAKRHDVPVSVCGEIAADPYFTILLLGLGVKELSMAARHIPMIKKVVRSVSFKEAAKVAQRALVLKTAEEIHRLLLRTSHSANKKSDKES